MPTFVELGASAPVARALARRNIHAPFPIQAMVMADALQGRDVLARSRTGSGKTLAFAIPIVERLQKGRGPGALVLVPTRELATQVADEFRAICSARGLRVAAVFGGVGLDKQAASARRADIVIATPGRLQDLLQRRLLSLSGVRALVLDEADRMLDMGFQPQVDRIVAQIPEERHTMFFSATLDGHVGRLAQSYTRDAVRHEIHEDKPAVAAADHRFVPVEDYGKVDTLVHELGIERDLALIFVRTKRGVDRLIKKLKARGIEALGMHGDMTQAARRRALDRFTDGRTDILIATDVAARGLDVDDITLVINYDPPQGSKDYVHRIGRTARAGRAGTGITFVTPPERADVAAIARELKLKEEFEADGLVMPKPQRTFSSHGRRSQMRPPRKRRV